jgi:pyruvate formate lyase activating enzyme
MHNAAQCRACGRCVAACTHQALALHKGNLVLDSGRCVMCGECTGACPWNARTIVGSAMTTDEVLSLVMRDKDYYDESGGGLTVSGGEPTMNGAFLLELLHKAQQAGIHTAIETCGSCNSALFEEVVACCDTVLFDVKHTDAEMHLQHTSAGLDRLWENLRIASHRSKTVVRIPLIPGFNTNEKFYQDVCRRLQELPLQEVHILPYHPFGISKYLQLGRTYPGLEITVPTERELEACSAYLHAALPCPILIHKH